MGSDLLGAGQRLVVGNGFHPLLAEGLDGSGVFPQVELGADQDDGDVRRVMVDLGKPLAPEGQRGVFQTGGLGASYLGLDVVERGRADDGEADEEDVGLGVRERAQPVVILLAGRVPQAQADGLAVYHDASRVVVETVPPPSVRTPAHWGGASGEVLTDTVGIYSPGKALVVYEMRRHVCDGPLVRRRRRRTRKPRRTLPTAPSPVTTHCGENGSVWPATSPMGAYRTFRDWTPGAAMVHSVVRRLDSAGGGMRAGQAEGSVGAEGAVGFLCPRVGLVCGRELALSTGLGWYSKRVRGRGASTCRFW